MRPPPVTWLINNSPNDNSKPIPRFWVARMESNYKRWTFWLKVNKTVKIAKIRMHSLWGKETNLLLANRRHLQIRDQGRSRQIPLMSMSFRGPLSPQVMSNQIPPRFRALWHQEVQDRSTWIIRLILEVWGQALSRIVNNSSSKPWETHSWDSLELPWDRP